MKSQRKIVNEYNRLLKACDMLYHSIAVQLGMSDCAFWILYAVQAADGLCKQSDICENISMSRQTVNSALKKLEKDGFLTLTLDLPDDQTMPDGSTCQYTPNDMSCGDLDGAGDFFDLAIGKREVVNLLPFVVPEAVILSALSDEEMEVLKLLIRGADVLEAVNNLDKELLVFLATDWRNFILAKEVT